MYIIPPLLEKGFFRKIAHRNPTSIKGCEIFMAIELGFSNDSPRRESPQIDSAVIVTDILTLRGNRSVLEIFASMKSTTLVNDYKSFLFI